MEIPTFDDLTKRLLVLTHLGISISHANGHRWIICATNAHDYNFEETLEAKGIHANFKVYGSVLDALNYVDFLLLKIDGLTLLDNFNETMSRHNGLEYDFGIRPGMEPMTDADFEKRIRTEFKIMPVPI